MLLTHLSPFRELWDLTVSESFTQCCMGRRQPARGPGAGDAPQTSQRLCGPRERTSGSLQCRTVTLLPEIIGEMWFVKKSVSLGPGSRLSPALGPETVFSSPALHFGSAVSEVSTQVSVLLSAPTWLGVGVVE